jgi:predicted DNA-binding ribbon-helix-helix protein
MIRTLMLELSKFNWEILRETAERRDVSPEGLVREAVSSYLAQRNSHRIAARVPKFVRDEPERASEGDGHARVDIELEEAELEELSEAAAEQQVPVESLVTHAVLLFIADLERQGGGTSR